MMLLSRLVKTVLLIIWQTVPDPCEDLPGDGSTYPPAP